MINYKLRGFFWLERASIPLGPTNFRQPTLKEAVVRFQIPLRKIGDGKRRKWLGIS